MAILDTYKLGNGKFLSKPTLGVAQSSFTPHSTEVAEAW